MEQAWPAGSGHVRGVRVEMELVLACWVLRVAKGEELRLGICMDMLSARGKRRQARGVGRVGMHVLCRRLGSSAAGDVAC